MAYARVNWQDLPNTTTPRNATNLNKMDSAIKDHDDKLLGNAPMGDVIVDSIRSKNMFNKNEIQIGGLTDTGEIVYNASLVYPPRLIEVKPSTKYTFSANASVERLAIGEYNSSKTFIQRDIKINASTYTITTTANTKYVILNSVLANIDNLQFEEGEGRTTYSPYQELNNQEAYSLSEQKIGTWVDGRTRYRKVVSGTLVAGDLDIDLTSLNIYEIIKVDGFCGNQRPLNFYFSGYSVSTRYDGAGHFYIFASSPYANDNFKMIIEYTKTSD